MYTLCTALTNCPCQSGAVVHLGGAEKSKSIFVTFRMGFKSIAELGEVIRLPKKLMASF